MRVTRVLVCAVVAALGATTAMAADITGLNANLVSVRSLSNEPVFTPHAVTPGSLYSDVTTFSGSGYINAGAATGNAITFLVADDISMTAAAAVNQFKFSVANFDPSASFSARPRVRFYADDNAGAPGTAIGGFSFNPITFSASSVNTYGAAIAPLALPQKFWAGITFDNVGGTATVAQLNELGQGLFTPPDVGTSADLDFITSGAGSNLVNNPAGSVRTSPFTANPNANYGWEFTVTPEPVSLSALAIALPFLARRRKA